MITEELLLDARTVNAILDALNRPVGNATEACAVVRALAIDNGLKRFDDTDTELSNGDFTPWMDRGAMMKRALRALDDLENWCHNNESEWSGWGDQVVPAGAIRWTKQVQLAVNLIKGQCDHIQDVRRVNLEPGDKLVLRVKERLSSETIARLREDLARVFPGVPVIILDNGASLDVLSTADGASREAESKARDENSVGVGMAIAAAILMRVWGDDVQAKEIIGAAGLTTEKKLLDIGVEEYDLCELRPLLDEAEQPA